MVLLTAQQEYQYMQQSLNEKQWRQYLALEAKRQGNIIRVAQAAGVSRNTIKRGIDEVENGGSYTPGSRIRLSGGGRKKIITQDPGLLPDLNHLLNPKGDPERRLLWTTLSVNTLTTKLRQKGHGIADTAVRRILLSLGYSLKANKKNIEGESHPDRDSQFEHINSQCQEFEEKGFPVISVDCKKKELIGNFKNNGKEWVEKGADRVVNVYDYTSLADGKAVPYGVYDLVTNNGFVNIGVDHDTAEFAVESIRRWWNHTGRKIYPKAKKLLITADGGGSNGVRNRLWKKSVQELANETGLSITICHFPRATSKWNRIEHRLFSFISINWRAKPLISLEVILELISHTTTKEGLTVTAVKDTNNYPTGIKIPDEQMQKLNLLPDEFHGEWNYTIKPQNDHII